MLVFLDSSPKKKESIMTTDAMIIILYESKISIVEIILSVIEFIVKKQKN
jgi:hypothetical protein